MTYSLPAHKEFRFLLPALQLAMPLGGVALEHLRRNSSLCAKHSHRLSSDGVAAEASDAATVGRLFAAAANTQQAENASAENEEPPAVVFPSASATLSVRPHLPQSPRHRRRSSEALLQRKRPATEETGVDARKGATDPKQRRQFPALYWAGVTSVVLQIPEALYFGLRHQRCNAPDYPWLDP